MKSIRIAPTSGVKRIVFKMWLSENIHSLACFGSLVRERYVEILRFASFVPQDKQDDKRYVSASPDAQCESSTPENRSGRLRSATYNSAPGRPAPCAPGS